MSEDTTFAKLIKMCDEFDAQLEQEEAPDFKKFDLMVKEYFSEEGRLSDDRMTQVMQLTERISRVVKKVGEKRDLYATSLRQEVKQSENHKKYLKAIANFNKELNKA